MKDEAYLDMKAELSSKLSQVIELISKDVLYDFLCDYAQSHEELAMALVSEFWQAEKDDYHSMVQQCLMHPSPAGIKNGDGFDWGAIAVDLSQMLSLADEKVKEGSLLDAAEIARYVMTLTCAEYEADHPYGENYSEMWWLRRKPLRDVLERARKMATELLIIGEDIDDDSQRGLVKEIAAECKPFKKSHICRIDTFLEDAQAKVLSPKRYVSWLQKKVDSTRGGFYRKQYMEKMVRFLDKIGKRDEAITAMEAIKNKDDELRLLYVDMLTEWKMYDEALQVADVEDDVHASIYSYPTKTLHILELINDREKTIAVCKARFVKTDRKKTYFNRLRQEMTREEWESFIDGTIQNADDVFLHDYDDVEAQIYMERKLYDHLVKFCLHTSYDAENNLENYAKYMSEADQRLVAQDIIERMKGRAPECKRGDDYSHFAHWLKRLADSSPYCKKIAKEVAEEILKENPNKAFKAYFERVEVM